MRQNGLQYKTDILTMRKVHDQHMYSILDTITKEMKSKTKWKRLRPTEMGNS